VLALTAGLLTWRLPSGPARRFCCSLLIFDALSTAVVAGYVLVGVDEINQYYICYFSWANPVVLILVSAIAGSELLASAGPRRAVAVVAVAAWWAFAAAPATRLTTVYVDPENPRAGYSTDALLPAGVAAVSALAAGRTIVLAFPHNAWPAVTGILVQAERTGVSACVADRHWKFMMTSQFICTPAQLAGGYRMSVYPAGGRPANAAAVARFLGGAVAVAGGLRT
jgi:voltage-gated potassium channel Kch